MAPLPKCRGQPMMERLIFEAGFVLIGALWREGLARLRYPRGIERIERFDVADVYG